MLMEYLQSYGLCFLELTFVLVALMLLHSLKHVIGTASFYLAMGVVMGFAQFVNAAGLNVAPSGSVSGLAVSLGSSILFAPFMAAVLMVYIVDGTLEAQRQLLQATRKSGWMIFVALAIEPFEIKGTPDLVRTGVKIAGAWHYNLNDYPKLMQVIRESPVIDKLISHVFGFSQVQEAFETSASHESAKVMLEPWA